MITKEKFLAYYRVQMGGKYNMITQSTRAMAEAELTMEEYFNIIKNYNKYYNAYVEAE